MSFTSFGLSEDILRALDARGYTKPTPIQAQAIPVVLSGQDLLAGAQTGTGKTAGFVLPILHKLSDKSETKGSSSGRPPIRALILTPTRELAAQVEESVRHYGAHSKLSSMTIFGGVNIRPQMKRLKGRIDILVATPGRLLDHCRQGTIDLSQIEVLVLDEADRMLDMGFIHDIRKILAMLPKKRQNLLFSATFSKEIKTLAGKFLHNPVTIEVTPRNTAAELVAQKVYYVDRGRKRDLLAQLITDGNWQQVLVFARTKHGANKLAEQLGKIGIPTTAIHGNKSQAQRTKALAEFKQGKKQVMVATDIAARGIDISELPHVVNFELPQVPEDYVHRIGRTGRAGSNGEAVSLVCIDEYKLLRAIEKLIKREIEKEVIEGFEPDPNAKPQPIQKGKQQQRSRSNHGGQRRASGGGRNNAGQGRNKRRSPRKQAA